MFGIIILDLNEDGNCSTDYLRIHDGSFAGDELIYSHCGGDRVKNTVYSSSYQLYICLRFSRQPKYEFSIKAIHAGIARAMEAKSNQGNQICEF